MHSGTYSVIILVSKSLVWNFLGYILGVHWYEEVGVSVPESHSHVSCQQPANGQHERPAVDGLPITTVRWWPRDILGRRICLFFLLCSQPRGPKK